MNTMKAKNPYFLDEPAIISFSGGRTSAYMLCRVLDAHDGTLPDYVKVLFANTGKEMPETLDFVHRCERELSVDIHWLELAGMCNISEPGERAKYNKAIKRTDYIGASRNGEPFDILLDNMAAIPNATARICTGYLKTRVMAQYLKTEIGFESPWLACVGIRADEERRARKIAGTISEGAEIHLPLWLDGVTASMVGEFWASMPWDLELPNNDGVTDWGNCDLCFLKGRSKRASIIRERPDLAAWWIKAEEKKGQKFRPDEPSYRQMRDYALAQQDMFKGNDESIPCFCGD